MTELAVGTPTGWERLALGCRQDVRYGALAVGAVAPQRHGRVVRVLGLGAQPLHVLQQQRRRGHLGQPRAVALQVQPQPLRGLAQQQLGGQLLQLVVPQAQLAQPRGGLYKRAHCGQTAERDKLPTIHARKSGAAALSSRSQ